jgi:hypothetical protein
MTYTIDQGHPLYEVLQPTLEAIVQKDKAVKEREEIDNMLLQSQALVQNLTGQLKEANKRIQELEALPKAPEAWETIADKIIAAGLALGKFNVPYKFGGDNFQEGGLDCSGFTKLLYDLFAGTKLKRVSGDQATQGTAVSINELRKGDLLFFTYSERNNGRPTHVGIYVGDGKMLHTANDTTRIHIADVKMSTVTAARRMF